MLVASTAFTPLAEIEARSLGMPGLRMVVLEHPIGTRETKVLEGEHLPSALAQFVAILDQGGVSDSV